jgi:hypothetical protein
LFGTRGFVGIRVDNPLRDWVKPLLHTISSISYKTPIPNPLGRGGVLGFEKNTLEFWEITVEKWGSN